jgi:type IV pilus assembly protein PilA
MKKMLKENKGFSLVELLIALLIMAVIAGTAITLFGGVLDSSKVGADRETAEAIKRAILTYMNATNDTDFSCIDIDSTKDAQDLLKALADKIEITSTTAGKDPNDLIGTYGPFLENGDVIPQQTGKPHWEIHITIDSQIITVEPAENDDLTIIETAST